MSKKVEITTINKTVEVTKAPVGRFIEALKQVKEISKHLAAFSELSQASIIEKLPAMIAESYDEIARIVAIAVPELTREEVDMLSIDELIDLIVAIIEVNEIEKLGDTIKKKLGGLNLSAVK